MKKVILIFIISFLLCGCNNVCSKEKLESVASPNNKYTVVTYLNNCGATIDWLVTAELCINNNCKEIYNCYHENASNVYWIDDETIFINNKILNVTKDTYNWKKDEDYYNKIYKR